MYGDKGWNIFSTRTAFYVFQEAWNLIKMEHLTVLQLFIHSTLYYNVLSFEAVRIFKYFFQQIFKSFNMVSHEHIYADDWSGVDCIGIELHILSQIVIVLYDLGEGSKFSTTV